jgi:uncharacterized membrane protein
MILRSHLVSMILYAAFVAIVLAFLRRDDRKARVRYGLLMFLLMSGGAVAFGWLMYLFAR